MFYAWFIYDWLCHLSFPPWLYYGFMLAHFSLGSIALQVKIQDNRSIAETRLMGSAAITESVGTVRERNSAGWRADTTKALGLFQRW